MNDAPFVITAALASLLICVVCAFTHPQRGECPRGWFVLDGIRTYDSWRGVTGSWSCQRPPLGGDDDTLTGHQTARDQPGELYGRIYCTNNQEPIVVSDRIVGCQARH